MSRKSRQNEAQQQYAQAAHDKAVKIRLIVGGALVVVLIALLAVGVPMLMDRDSGNQSAQAEAGAANAPAADGELPTSNAQYVQIDVAGYGTIVAELYPDVAPITVENFLKLADEGFYNGLTFHRICTGFMIQGGDPKGNGTGGSDEKIKGEFSANGVQNDLKHTRGVLSMARSNAYDSASSQFFIMHEDATHLDGQYAAFGRVISGMEVVDAICAGTPVTDANGTVAKANQPVITSIQRIEKPE